MRKIILSIFSHKKCRLCGNRADVRAESREKDTKKTIAELYLCEKCLPEVKYYILEIMMETGVTPTNWELVTNKL